MQPAHAWYPPSMTPEQSNLPAPIVLESSLVAEPVVGFGHGSHGQVPICGFQIPALSITLGIQEPLVSGPDWQGHGQRSRHRRGHGSHIRGTWVVRRCLPADPEKRRNRRVPSDWSWNRSAKRRRQTTNAPATPLVGACRADGFGGQRGRGAWLIKPAAPSRLRTIDGAHCIGH